METTEGTEQNVSTVNGGEASVNAGSTNTRETKQASGKQLVAIIFILAISTKMFLLPILLIRATGRDAYIALTVYSAFELIMLVPILIAIRVSDADLFVVLESALGKAGAKIAVAVIGLFLFFKLNAAVAEIMAFYGTNVFADFDTSLMMIVLLTLMTAAGTHTLRSLCRLNEILVPIITVCLFVLVAIVVMTAFDLANIFPAMADGKKFAGGISSHTAWVGDFTPLVLFIGRTKTKKRTWCFAAGAGVIGTAITVFFAIVLCAAFGNAPFLADNTTNLSNILQFSTGNVYGRLDMFSSVLWSVSAIIEAALFFYVVCRCVSFVIGSGAHFPISLGVSVCTYIVQIFAFIDPTIFNTVMTSIACSAIVPITAAVIPLAAMVCALIHARKTKRRNIAERKGARS